MLTITTDFGPFVRHKDQILMNKLHYETTSEVLAMLMYGEGYTDKSIAYLLDNGAVVGYAYVEHFLDRDNKPRRGTFGIFLHPNYRKQGHSYDLVAALKNVMIQQGWYGPYIEVDPKAVKIVRKVFGPNYVIQVMS